MKLNLGSGPIPIDPYHEKFVDNTWEMIDLYPNSQKIIKMDVRKLEFEDNSIEQIYAANVLEHMRRNEVDSTLKEWHRVLMPGGKIRISVPDSGWACKLFNKPDRTEKELQDALEVLYSSQLAEGFYHYYAFDERLFRSHFTKYFKETFFEREFESHQLMVISLEGVK